MGLIKNYLWYHVPHGPCTHGFIIVYGKYCIYIFGEEVRPSFLILPVSMGWQTEWEGETIPYKLNGTRKKFTSRLGFEPVTFFKKEARSRHFNQLKNYLAQINN